MLGFSSSFFPKSLSPLEQAEKYLKNFYKQIHVPDSKIENIIREKIKIIEQGEEVFPSYKKEIWRNAYNQNIQIIVDPIRSQGCAAATQLAPSKQSNGFIKLFNRELPTIYLHPLLLINPSEIPKDFFTDRDHEESSPFYKILAIWLQNKFNLKKSFKISRNLLNTYLEIWKKPELVDEVRHFILAHEFAHHYYNHFKRPWHLLLSFFVTCVIVCLFASSLTAEAMFFVTYFTLKVTNVVVTCLFLYYYRKNEVAADLLAYKLTQQTKGAKVFFEAVDKTKTTEWNRLPTWKKIYTVVVQPEAVFPLSHPSPKTRIDYLEAAAAKKA